MKSLIHTAASLALRVAYQDGTEKMIGFCRSFNYSVSQGQKLTYVVDSPQPAEISQGAGPQGVKGSLVLYLPKGTTPESSGLVSYRVDTNGSQIAPLSKYIHFRIYDRQTGNLVFACEFCKVSTYSVSIVARGVVEVQMQFDGLLGTPGLTL